MNILLVEDTESIIKGLTYSFKKDNHNLTVKTTIKDSKEYLLNNSNIDLIILDITLPDGNGFNLFENTIKDLKIPTIFLTAKDEEDDIVKGLNIGAEDYITKPFSTKELMARVNRILLRAKKQSIIKIKDISFDMDKLVLMKDNTPIELTALELKLVNLLFNNLNKVVSRNVILDKIWDWTGNYVDDHTVTVYFNIYEYKTYTNNFNNKIGAIISVIKDKYPEITDKEIAEIINSDEFETNDFFTKYGIDINNKSILIKNDKDYHIFLVINMSFLAITIIILLILYIRYNHKKENDIKDIIKCIEQINKKNYELQIDITN